nr:hypothetical protein [Anaerotruncus sp. G3(2012)]
MIGQKKRLTASAARRKHSVTAAIFDCCTLICRIGEKLAVYPSQMPRVLEYVADCGKFTISFCAVHSVIYGDKVNIIFWKYHFTDMDKIIKPCGVADKPKVRQGKNFLLRTFQHQEENEDILQASSNPIWYNRHHQGGKPHEKRSTNGGLR